jgi:hypothetical protein
MRTLTLLSFLLAACSGRGGDTSDTSANGDGGSTDGGSSDGGSGDSGADGGITINGTAKDLITGAAAAEGLCILAADPTAAITGGELTIIANTTTASDGTFALLNVDISSQVGLLVLAQDCGQGTHAVMPTATGISANSYAGMADGDTLDGATGYVVDSTLQAGIDASLTAAGYSGSILTDGALLGFVFDTAGTPLSGVTVTGSGSGTTTYYADSDSSDGLFTNASVGVNAATDATANAMFLIPAAPIWSYAADDGGAHTFSSVLAGSQPGYAVVIAFYGA